MRAERGGSQHARNNCYNIKSLSCRHKVCMHIKGNTHSRVTTSHAEERCETRVRVSGECTQSHPGGMLRSYDRLRCALFAFILSVGYIIAENVSIASPVVIREQSIAPGYPRHNNWCPKSVLPASSESARRPRPRALQCGGDDHEHDEVWCVGKHCVP